jgi:RNA-directed DNA polymerase
MNKKPLKILFDAMYHGKYDFDDFLNCDVSENYKNFELGDPFKNKKRKISNPNKKLKAYHKFLNLFLFEYLPINKDVVFSYRKGFSVYDSVRRHAGSRNFFQADLTDFFKNIESSNIAKVILENGSMSPISDIDLYLGRIIDLICVDDSLPAGFPTSPIVSNVCLFEFDNVLNSYCVQQGLIYTRYSDDIIVSGIEKFNHVEVAEKMESILKDLFGDGLKMNKEKSKYTWVGKKIKLLGMVVLPDGKITVDIKFKNKIEVLLHFYIHDKEKFLDKIEMRGNMKDAEAKLSGYLNYINTIDSSYLDKLRKKYGTTIVDMFFHKSTR